RGHAVSIDARPLGCLSVANRCAPRQATRLPYTTLFRSLGFDGNMDSCITIRTMTLTGNDLYIQAGAGVVADSDPESEYQETINKASALAKAVHLAELVFREKSLSLKSAGGR